MKQSYLGLVFILVSATSFAQLRTQLPTDEAPNPNETTVAVNKSDPANIVAACNINHVFYSTDSGQSWTHQEVNSTEYGFYGDPVLLSTENNSFLIAHLSKTSGKEWGKFFDRIVIQRSSDGGRSWSDGVAVGYNQDKVQDKPWITLDRSNTSSRGNIYLTWTEFDEYGSTDPDKRSRILFSRSTDDGLSWSEPIVVSDRTGDCVDDDNTVEGATVATDSEGNLYCVWAGFGKIFMDVSTDGGQTWGEDRIIAEQRGGWNRDVPHLYRTNAMPFVGCAPNSNRLWVSFASNSTNGSHVVLLSSDDKGITWTSSDVSHRKDENHFLPMLDVDPETSDAYVMYMLSGTGTALSWLTKPFLISASKSDTSSESKIDIINQQIGLAFPSPGETIFYGDYHGVDVEHGYVHIVYTAYDMSDGLKLEYARIPTRQNRPSDQNYMTDQIPSNILYNLKNDTLRVHFQNVKDVRVKVRLSKRRFAFGRSYQPKFIGDKDEIDIAGEEIIELPLNGRFVRMKIKFKKANKDHTEWESKKVKFISHK